MDSRYSCCDAFCNYINNAGSSGLSFVVVDQGRNGNPSFRIQARACDVEHIGDVTGKRYPELRAKLAILTQTGLRYCPACGADLNQLAVKHRAYFLTLSVQMKDLILE